MNGFYGRTVRPSVPCLDGVFVCRNQTVILSDYEETSDVRRIYFGYDRWQSDRVVMLVYKT